ncbi:MAG TPA: hypothetical protein VHF05_02455 [Candidatus Paceibacterota bacterium]|jgi:hypothetical protein|nr:hypothetical protein [Candidatus Paceibacterota bacterium]
MKQEIIDYLESQHTGVLAVKMPDGSLHGATVHFAYSLEPLALFFLTSLSSKKAGAFGSGACEASFVIGTDEIAMKTLQLDGTLESVPADDEKWKEAYLERYPGRKDWSESPEAMRLKFTPRWWRYSDLKDRANATIIASE